MTRAVVIMGALLTACATSVPPSVPAPKPAPVPVIAAADVDHWGDSTQTAVEVPADAPNEGVDFENNWIYDRYGRFRRVKYGLGHDDQRRYDVITIELPDSTLHTVYFDITEMWLRWKPSSPK